MVTILYSASCRHTKGNILSMLLLIYGNNTIVHLVDILMAVPTLTYPWTNIEMTFKGLTYVGMKQPALCIIMLFNLKVYCTR